MARSEDLYERGSERPKLAQPVLLCSLDGFIDAGRVGALVREQALNGLQREIVARFDIDRLIDYRSRRPVMTYVEDHWESYDPPELLLEAVRDAAGTPFLLLSGPEPDHEWERFTSAVRGLVEELTVRVTVGFHGIPMAVPHTRPIGMTAHATRPELVPDHTRWLSRVQVPGSAAALLEYRLGQAGHDALGFAVHVPHYLGQTPYPPAALAALDAVSATTGLSLPGGELRTAAEHADDEIARQVGDSEEISALVHTLESQYDAYVANQGPEVVASGELAAIPTADELGAQFEQFLAEQDGRGDGRDG